MSEERIQKIKWTALSGAAIAMTGILLMQVVARWLMSGGTLGVNFGALQLFSLLKATAIFGLVGGVCGFIAGIFTPVTESRPTRVKHEDEEDEDEAAQETLSKLGIAKERDRQRRAE